MTAAKSAAKPTKPQTFLRSMPGVIGDLPLVVLMSVGRDVYHEYCKHLKVPAVHPFESSKVVRWARHWAEMEGCPETQEYRAWTVTWLSDPQEEWRQQRRLGRRDNHVGTNAGLQRGFLRHGDWMNFVGQVAQTLKGAAPQSVTLFFCCSLAF